MLLLVKSKPRADVRIGYDKYVREIAVDVELMSVQECGERH